MAELHTYLFSRHASPLPAEVCVFVAVDERGEDVVSDEICRGCNGKQQRRKRAGRSVQLPDWVMNKIKRQHIIALTWVTKMKSLSCVSERCPTNTTHRPPTVQCEAISVSAKPLRSEWVSIGRWV